MSVNGPDGVIKARPNLWFSWQLGASARMLSAATVRGGSGLNWTLYAALSALFAGLTAVLAKIGVSEVPSNLATLVRTVVVVLFATGIVTASGQFQHLGSISGRGWLALILSGVATGLSWLFYFAALKHGPISGVAPIDKLSFVIAMVLGFFVLKETVRPLTLAGAALIVAGVLLTLPTVQQRLERFLF